MQKINHMPQFVEPNLTCLLRPQLVGHINATHERGVLRVNRGCENLNSINTLGTINLSLSLFSLVMSLVHVEINTTSFFSTQVTARTFRNLCISHSKEHWGNFYSTFTFQVFGHFIVPIAYVPLPTRSTNKSMTLKSQSVTTTWVCP